MVKGRAVCVWYCFREDYLCESQIPGCRRVGVYIQPETSAVLYVFSCHRLAKSPVRVMRSRRRCSFSITGLQSAWVWKWTEKVNAAELSSCHAVRRPWENMAKVEEKLKVCRVQTSLSQRTHKYTGLCQSGSAGSEFPQALSKDNRFHLSAGSGARRF